MTWEDYKDETRENIKQYIRDNYDKEDLEFVSDRFVDNLRDDLFMCDYVTARCLALDYIDLKEVIDEVYEEMEEE